MSANGRSASLQPTGQNGPQDAKTSRLTPEQRSYLVQYLNSIIANELPAETQDNVPAMDVAVANVAPDAEHPPMPTKAAPKWYWIRKVIVAPVAGWPELFLTLKLWLIRNGFAYRMDDQTNGHYAVFVFDGSKEGLKAPNRFYEVWNGRAHTAAAGSPICAMRMIVVREVRPPPKQ